MSVLVPVRPVATVAQLAQFLLSGGYMETPSEYLDQSEIQQYLEEIAISVSEHAASEMSLDEVLDVFDLDDKLDVVERLSGNDWDSLMGSLTLACSQHPAACVVSSGDTALCIAGFDGSATGDESRYFSLISNAKQQIIPKVSTVDSEYDLKLPHIPAGKNYNALIVQSKGYAKEPPRKKTKGKEEEIPIEIEEEEEKEEQEDEEDEDKVTRKKLKPKVKEEPVKKRKRSTRTKKK